MWLHLVPRDLRAWTASQRDRELTRKRAAWAALVPAGSPHLRRDVEWYQSAAAAVVLLGRLRARDLVPVSAARLARMSRESVRREVERKRAAWARLVPPKSSLLRRDAAWYESDEACIAALTRVLRRMHAAKQGGGGRQG